MPEALPSAPGEYDSKCNSGRAIIEQAFSFDQQSQSAVNPASLKVAITETGSVAAMSAPKSSAPAHSQPADIIPNAVTAPTDIPRRLPARGPQAIAFVSPSSESELPLQNNGGRKRLNSRSFVKEHPRKGKR
jgi:hypothetical protein